MNSQETRGLTLETAEQLNEQIEKLIDTEVKISSGLLGMVTIKTLVELEWKSMIEATLSNNSELTKLHALRIAAHYCRIAQGACELEEPANG